MNSGVVSNRSCQSVLERSERNTNENQDDEDLLLIWEKFLQPSFLFSEHEYSGKHWKQNGLVPRAQYIDTLLSGKNKVFFRDSGRNDLWSMMTWKVLPGNGKVLMEVWTNLRSDKKMSVRILRTGGKNWIKRMLQVDEHGIPLSIVVAWANRHDSKLTESLLLAKILQAPDDQEEHLCLDAGFVWPEVYRVVTGSGYIPHIRPRGEDVRMKKNDPEFQHPDWKPRRWIVEVAHSWFNNFRKVKIKYEKKSKNYLALLHIVAAIICFRRLDII